MKISARHPKSSKRIGGLRYKSDGYRYNTSIKHETRDKYTYVVKDWSQIFNPFENPVKSDIFPLSGNIWQLEIYTKGIYEHSDYVAVRLVNMSDVEMTASYTIKVVNENPQKDISWTDPDGILNFQKHGSGDDSWGPDDLILIKLITRADKGFRINDRVTFEVDIRCYGEELECMLQTVVVRKKYEALATPIATLEQQDQDDVIIKAPCKMDIEQESQLQDRLIGTRLSQTFEYNNNNTISSFNSSKSISQMGSSTASVSLASTATFRSQFSVNAAYESANKSLISLKEELRRKSVGKRHRRTTTI